MSNSNSNENESTLFLSLSFILLLTGLIGALIKGILWQVVVVYIVSLFLISQTGERFVALKKHSIHFFVLYLSLFNVGIFWGQRILDGFTPAEKLAVYIYERSKHKHSGSICRDGKKSYSQGRGSCSSHGGVASEFYKGQPTKSMEECIEEAIRISWVD